MHRAMLCEQNEYRGYGVNLTDDTPEFFIFICHIFKLGRANKSEIGRIEKENTPFAENIIL